jgi:uncharacterized protein YcaQ
LPITLTPTTARRLAITSQRLAGPRPENIMAVMAAIRCLQIDPIRAVDYTQHLVLRSRLGNFDPAGLSRLLWGERTLFEYWAHAASIVLAADFSLHQAQMHHYARGNWKPRTKAWLAERRNLRAHILACLEADGPLPSKVIKDLGEGGMKESRWFNREVPVMLDCLQMEGLVMVTGRDGRTRLWDLAHRWLPEKIAQEPISKREASKQAVEHTLRALGVARARHIREHFIRKMYKDLPGVLAELVDAGRVISTEIVENGESWPDTWYLHTDRLPMLEALQKGDWQPRTSLLSPFDNLICDRERTEQLFDFHYRIEIYVPKAKRQYGYYVLPILHGDQIIGRISPIMDRKKQILTIDGIFAEPGMDRQVPGRVVQEAITELATYLKAKEIVYSNVGEIPAGWWSELRNG